MSRYSQPSDFSPSLPKPALCIMAQGRKEVRLADEYFAYDPLNYLVVSVSMPISGRVLEISPSTRYWLCAWTLTRPRSPR